MIIEGGYEGMEIDVTMQFDEEKIRMENDQFMEYKNEHDFE